MDLLVERDENQQNLSFINPPPKNRYFIFQRSPCISRGEGAVLPYYDYGRCIWENTVVQFLFLAKSMKIYNAKQASWKEWTLRNKQYDPPVHNRRAPSKTKKCNSTITSHEYAKDAHTRATLFCPETVE